MTKTHQGWLFCLAATACVLIAVVATYLALSEAYGSGPPYFGRTENMDKWKDPVPYLVVFDLVCVAAAALLWRIGKQLLRSADGRPQI